MEDAGAEEIEACSAVHGSLDHLETVDSPFHGARAPGQRERRLDGGSVSAQALGEAAQRTVAAAVQPGAKADLIALPDKVGKGTRLAHGPADLRRRVDEPGQEAPVEACDRAAAQDQMGRPRAPSADAGREP